MILLDVELMLSILCIYYKIGTIPSVYSNPLSLLSTDLGLFIVSTTYSWDINECEGKTFFKKRLKYVKVN